MSVVRCVLFVCCISIGYFSSVMASEEENQAGFLGFFSALTDSFKQGFEEGKKEKILGAKFENALVELAAFKVAMSIFVYAEERLPENFDEMQVTHHRERIKAMSSISLGSDGALVGVLPEEFGVGKYLSLKPELDNNMQIVAWSLVSNVDPAVAKGATYVE